MSTDKQTEPLWSQGAMAQETPEKELRPFGEAVDGGGPVSLWLYGAGLIVTLAGLYAVNFGLNEPGFAHMTYGLALMGYLLSYVLRLRRISMQALHIPLLVCVALLIFASASSERGPGWLLPASIGDDRAKSLQMIFVWMAIIHSFLLSSDAAVLFSCVPCMTMIALVSTTSTDPEIQNAFLLFIAAATFLMIHENFLRTRTAAVRGRTARSERRLFGGQWHLAALCVLGALALANLVAIPIRQMGQALYIPGVLGPLANNASKPTQQSSPNVMVSEGSSVELARGPVSESDAVLLRVRCDRGLYWRGTTFDYYTGHTFRNRLESLTPLYPAGGAVEVARGYNNFRGMDTRTYDSHPEHFQVRTSEVELSGKEMEGASLCVQEIAVAGGIFSQLYGAGNVEQVDTHFHELKVDPAGSMLTYDTLPVNIRYQVTSRVPDDSPDRLRAASSQLKDVPEPIRRRYLQKAPEGEMESLRLRALARSITRGLKNNYDKAVAIKDYIGQTCKYNLQAKAVPRDRDVVDYFLQESQEGYCDSFGAAMTMLCRYAGIPARLASGFLTGDADVDGSYIVRQRHKHIWSELFFPRVGWIPFDATENAQDISDHSGREKRRPTSFLNWIVTHGWLPPMLIALIMALAFYLFKTEVADRFARRRGSGGTAGVRPETNVQIMAAYATACVLLARRKLARSASTTPDEYARWVAQRTGAAAPEMNALLARLTALQTRYRYGPDVASEQEVREAREALGALRAALARMRRNALTPLSSDAPPSKKE